MDGQTDQFDLTLEECKLILEHIDGLIILDEENRIKYLSPDMVERIGIMTAKSDPSASMIGQKIDEVHPISGLLPARKNGFKEKFYFYFTYTDLNISVIKPIVSDGKLRMFFDYDIVVNQTEFQELMGKIEKYARSGLLDIEKWKQDKKKSEDYGYIIKDILGGSESIHTVKEQIINVATSDSTVMITGPTGSGKELIAHAIHNLSNRRYMVEVNCAEIPESLMESELFGYDEGTFTGAKKGGKIGKFEMANKGTIFLDEIDQLSYYMQPKLLRVLQERKVTRIGGTVVPLDIRVIAATNKNLRQLVKEGKFREDLYYRLNVIEIHNPSLAERKEDIPVLVQKQIAALNQRLNRSVETVSDEVMQFFLQYDWPGNIRELNNVIERAMTNCRETVLEKKHFQTIFSELTEGNDLFPADWEACDNPLEQIRNQAEKEAILRALDFCGQNRIKTAKLLKISRANLYNKLEKYNIRNPMPKE